MAELRNEARSFLDMPVTKEIEDLKTDYWISDLSPTGVRLARHGAPCHTNPFCKLELHLVPGGLSTVIEARRVWQDDDYEAFEFIEPTIAQRCVLERLLGNS